MKDFDKNNESTYLKYWDVGNLSGWAMSQRMPVDSFSGLKIFLSLMKASQKVIMKKVNKDIFLKLMLTILKSYMSSITI